MKRMGIGMLTVLFVLPGVRADAGTNTFDTAAHYTNYFVNTRDTYTSGGGSYGWSGDNGGEMKGVSGAGASGTSMDRYDTNAGDGVPTNDGFLTNAISMRFRFTTVGGQVALVARMPTAKSGYGVETVLNVYNYPTETNKFGLYTYYDARSYGGGTLISTRTTITVNPPRKLTNYWYTLRFEMTADPDPVFTARLFDGTSQIGSQVRTLTSALSNDYDGPGSVGFRTSFSAGADKVMEIDDFVIEGVDPPVSPSPGTTVIVR